MTLVAIDDLRGCLDSAFARLGLGPDDARGLTGLLVDSELRGHRSHGVAALGLLVRPYSDRKLNPRPQVRVLRETDGALLLDGDRGCGPAAPSRAMRWCIERAREQKGMAVAAEHGEPLPEGLILDALGLPTTDPAAFFAGDPSRRSGAPTRRTRGSAWRRSSTR